MHTKKQDTFEKQKAISAEMEEDSCIHHDIKGVKQLKSLHIWE